MASPAFKILLHHPAVQALLAAAGDVACHLVGGVLRDHALGLPVHDVDAVVAGRGLEIARRAAEILPARLVLLGGKDFAAYRLVGKDATLDLWDRAGASLHEDLARRDFSINAFAWEPRTGEVVDPFGGLADLRRRVLRATTPESFAGDPVRVLRLPRLLLRLPGFAAEPETLKLARRSSPRLGEVAAERVRDELAFLFEHPQAHLGLALLVALDVYPGLWLGSPGEPGGSGGALLELEALPERIRELRELDREAAGTVDAKAARFAATFVPLPLNALERCRDAGYLTRAVAADVALLLEFDALPENDLGRRRFLHRAGALWPTAACSLGARVTLAGDLARWRRALSPLVELARNDGPEIFDPPRLLTGEDAQELLGIPPGPELGRALAAVRQAQIDGKVRTRAEAVAWLRSTSRSAIPRKTGS